MGGSAEVRRSGGPARRGFGLTAQATDTWELRTELLSGVLVRDHGYPTYMYAFDHRSNTGSGQCLGSLHKWSSGDIPVKIAFSVVSSARLYKTPCDANG